ncbi:MAG: bifunctional deaminase-reductase domain protein [Solirubrobacterales bacterium]|nr:bifunctional deaminase-reductase domain protein [Solirubrobacterales bacterium]
MRRLIESTLLALDGVIGEPRAWASEYFDSEAQEKALEQLMASDAMLMGRHTYEIFFQTWPNISGPYSDRMNGIRKYVFSSTLQDADWNNSTIVRGDVAAEVAKLKHQDGQDLVMYGHGPLGETLLEHDLLDELQFAIHPLLVGSGALLFREGQKQTLKLIGTKTLQTGVVILTYQPATT